MRVAFGSCAELLMYTDSCMYVTVKTFGQLLPLDACSVCDTQECFKQIFLPPLNL